MDCNTIITQLLVMKQEKPWHAYDTKETHQYVYTVAQYKTHGHACNTVIPKQNASNIYTLTCL